MRGYDHGVKWCWHEWLGPGAAIGIALHGFTGTGRDFESLAGCLDGFRRLRAFDLPGHGATGPRGDHTEYQVEGMCRSLAHAFAELAAPVTLIGYSMGARLALSVAATDAIRHLSRLVLISGTPGIAGAQQRAARQRADDALAEDIRTRGIGWFSEYWARVPILQSQKRAPPAVIQAVTQRRLAQNPDGLAGSLQGFGAGNMPPLWDALPRVTTACLWITGEDDAKFTDLAAQAAALMPNAQHTVIPNAGHAPHLERPRAVAAAIERFI